MTRRNFQIALPGHAAGPRSNIVRRFPPVVHNPFWRICPPVSRGCPCHLAGPSGSSQSVSLTEHLENADCRYGLIFPELEPHLRAVYSEPGDSEYVITRYRDTNRNLRTRLERIIAKDRLRLWSRWFHNLRATRHTELRDRFPTNVAAAWPVNTGAVAMEHWMMATEAHFEAAIREPVNCTQNCTQYPLRNADIQKNGPDGEAPQTVGISGNTGLI